MPALDPTYLTVLGILTTTLQVMGIIAAVHAIMGVRSAQGAIAWAVSLVTLPLFSLPLYLVFGSNRFRGYINARREGDQQLYSVAQYAIAQAREQDLILEGGHPQHGVLERLVKLPFTTGNLVELLVDGEDTFAAIFSAIQQATDYILVQFFIVRGDQLGTELQEHLIRKSKEGVRVYFLYDEIGSRSLSRQFIQQLREAGVQIRAFSTSRGLRDRFQYNFRNHRKSVVVDGRVAYVGGSNVGDEYMGRDTRFGAWRDTHVEVQGPAVEAIQLAFIEDWYWASGDLIPDLDWLPDPPLVEHGQRVLVLPTGPADDLETCGLFFVHIINTAAKRLWIASPYFVPDQQVICALQLAAMRGVDVRIMLPSKVDHLLVYLSSFSFLGEAEKAGVKIYRYEPGFMHHKVVLADDRYAAIGTANLDNRSFRLNFEIIVLVDDPTFASQTEAMFAHDFEQCRQATAEELAKRSIGFKLAVRVARLMAPLQ